MKRQELISSKEYWSTNIALSLWTYNGSRDDDFDTYEKMAESIVDDDFIKAMEEYRSLHWTSPCICPQDEKTGETLCCNLCGKPTARTSEELPGDEALKARYGVAEGHIMGAQYMGSIASPLLASKDARIRELEEALVQANENIKVWHGDEMYDVYYNNAPEMKKIKKALTPTKN